MKQILTGAKGREEIYKGVKTLADVVRVTLGAKGRNVIININNGKSAPHVTKDGVTAALSINLENPIENMGATLLKEVAFKTVEIAGDGTTSSVVLADSIVCQGIESIDAGANQIGIKKGIEKAAKKVIEEIKKYSTPITSNSEILQISSISANNDYEIGEKIAYAYDKIGNKGSLSVEEGTGNETTVSITEGMSISRGYISHHFINSDRGRCILENPFILLTDLKITSFKDILPIIEQTNQSGRPILIIADDVDGNALSTLTINSVNGKLKVCAIKAPDFGEMRKNTMKDIAIATGGKIIAADLGKKIENVNISDLGQAERVTIERTSTLIVRKDSESIKKEIEAQCEYLTEQHDQSEVELEKKVLSQRISRLKGEIAIIKVGGATDVEMKEKKDRIEDALCATRASIEEGVIAGGGSIFLNIAHDLELEGDTEDEQIGINILKHAITQPFFQILENAGVENEEQNKIADKIVEKGYGYGYNAITERVENLRETGIIDPTKVLRVSLENAVSVACTFLTTEAVVSETYTEQFNQNQQQNHN